MLLTAARPSVGTTQLPLGHATVSPFPHAHLPSGMLDRAAPLPRHPACLPETAVGVSPSAMLRLPLDPRYELIKKDLSRNLAPLHAERRPTQQTGANSCVAAASHARKIVVIQGGNCQQMFHQHTGSEYPPINSITGARPGPVVDLSTCGPRPLFCSLARLGPRLQPTGDATRSSAAEASPCLPFQHLPATQDAQTPAPFLGRVRARSILACRRNKCHPACRPRYSNCFQIDRLAHSCAEPQDSVAR